MFETTLKYMNLFILPNPKFTVPESEGDFVYRIKQCKADPVSSYISNLITPAKQVSKSSPSSEARAMHRHTICCGSSMPTTGSDVSFFKFDHGPKYQSPPPFTSFNSDTSFLGPWEPVDFPNSQHRIRVVTPTDTPTPSSVRRQLDRDIAHQYCPSQAKRDRTSVMRTFSKVFEKSVKTSRKGKEKEKRNSAPPILPSPRQIDQVALSDDIMASIPSKVSMPTALMCALPHMQLISPPEELLVIIHKNPKERHNTMPDASYTSSKLFELDLSPILEDSQTFSEPLDVKPDSNSSNSSYGELLDERMTDYYSLSYYGSFGGLAMDDDVEDRVNAYMQDSAQGFGDIQDTDWQNGHFLTTEDSIVIPELRLTVPTPEMGTTSQEYPSKTKTSSDDVLTDHIDNPFLTSVGLIRAPYSAEWPTLDFGLNTGTKSAFGTGSFGNFTCDNEIYEAVERSSANLAYGSLANTAAVERANTPTLNVSPSGFAKNRAGEDGKLKPSSRFWKRFSASSILKSSGNSRRSVTSRCDCETTTTGIASFVDGSATSQSLSAGVAIGEAWTEKRYSGSPSLATTACVIEEGEHMASRLFGTSNTGKRKETSRKHVNEERDRADKHINLKDVHQPRRRSFGFHMKPLNEFRRYIQNDSLIDVEHNRTTVQTGLKRFWARRQTSSK